jgi:hypothetical protein
MTMPLRLRPLPHPRRPLEERRKTRPQGTFDALKRALNAAVARGDLDAVLITDDKGMLVSASDTALDLSMLAAVTPFVARGHVVANVKRGGKPRELAVRTVEVLGETLHVALLGGSPEARAAEVAVSAAATQRILAA